MPQPSLKPADGVKEEGAYNENRKDKPYTVSELLPADTGVDNTRSGNGVSEQFALFAANGEPTPQARQVAKVVEKQVKSFTKTVRVVTGHIRTGLTHIHTPQDLAHVTAGIRKKTVENVVVVVTDAKGKIVGVIDHTTGSVNPMFSQLVF